MHLVSTYVLFACCFIGVRARGVGYVGVHAHGLGAGHVGGGVSTTIVFPKWFQSLF